MEAGASGSIIGTSRGGSDDTDSGTSVISVSLILRLSGFGGFGL
jgi:hypothetical protein